MNHCLPLANAPHPVHELLDVSSFEAFLLKVAGAALILIATGVVSWLLRRYLARRLEALDQGDDAVLRGYRRFFTAVVWVTGVAFALHALGLDLTHAFTAGGLLAVAVAFAMKTLAENLVAGLILRAEHVIRTGDVLVLEGGRMVRVEKIGMRATTVRTKQEQDLILPNADLVQSQVVNCTRHDRLCRIDATVGIASDSDLGKARSTLDEVLSALDWTAAEKPPQVRLQGFGGNVLEYRVLVWMEDPWHAGGRKAELTEAIWTALREAEITVPYPQLDVHLSAPGLSEARADVST